MAFLWYAYLSTLSLVHTRARTLKATDILFTSRLVSFYQDQIGAPLASDAATMLLAAFWSGHEPIPSEQEMRKGAEKDFDWFKALAKK